MHQSLTKLTIFLAVLSCLAACDRPGKPGADTVFTGGAVYTVDEDRSWAEAVAITNGEIVFVGSDEDAASFVGTNTDVVELDGKMLMPGFHDAHSHVRHGGSSLLGCSLHDSADIPAIRNRLTECVSSGDYGPDDWVIGGGWPLAAFPDGAPAAAMLDELLGGRPAYFSDAFGHNAWVSTRAMELAGIDSETPDPPQGVIVRDPENGAAIGTLRDSAMALIEEVLPPETDTDRYEALLAGLAEANSFGITAYIDPGVTKSGLETYRSAAERGDITARVVASLSPLGALAGKFGAEIFEMLSERERYRSEFLNVDSVKVYIDGVIETRTSFMLEPYSDGSNFPPFYSDDELRELYPKLDALGLQIHTHAIGDGAIRSALDAYEHTLYENGPNDNRHQIVHLQLIDEADIPRFGELNVAANFQCMWCYPDVYIDLAVDIVGKERVQAFYPVRSVKDSGGLLVGGSDWDVSSLNPLDAIETTIHRQSPYEDDERVLGEDEEVDLATALDMYTRNAAYIMRLEDVTGSIEVGKRADLVVLDRNLFEIPTNEINEAQVLMTLVDGNTVYRAADATAPES